MPPTSPNQNPNPGSPGGMNEGSRQTNSPGTPGLQRNLITDVEEVSFTAPQIKKFSTNPIQILFLGRSTITTTARIRLFSIHSANGANAILVLVIVSASGERLSRLFENCFAYSFVVGASKR